MKKLDKKYLITFFSIVFGAISIINAGSVSAQNINNTIPNPSRFDSLEDIINFMGGLIRPLFLITFAVIILVGAFNLATSQGDEEKIKGARDTFVSGIAGFAIAVLAPTIVNAITSLLGVDGFSF